MGTYLTSMLLERRIVKILNNHVIFEGEINRNDFITYLINDKLWPRINYYSYKKEELQRIINNTIDDCIGYKYIKSNGEFKVGERGRDYLKPLGFLEEFLKRRKRTVVSIIGFLAALLIAHLWKQ